MSARTALAAARGWLRGPHIPIALVAMAIWLDYATFRQVGPGREWPVETWQMYAAKIDTTPIVSYRRYLHLYDDGRTAPSDMRDPVHFLVKPYRIDLGFAHNLPAFMLEVLRLMKERGDDREHLAGWIYETRVWSYRELSLADHLNHDPPTWSYRAVIVPPHPRAPAARSPGVTNGDFDLLDAATGAAVGWEGDGKPFTGVGVALASSDLCLLLPAAPDGSPRRSQQALALPEGETIVHAQALVYAPRAGAAIAIEHGDMTAPTIARGEVAAGAGWQLLEVTATVAAGAAARVVLHGAGDACFDDVRVETRATPAPAGSAPPT